jgi:hypothetical protein
MLDLSKGRNIDTSQQAYKRARRGAQRMYGLILAQLKPIKGTRFVGATCKELSDFFKIPMHRISGRLTELCELNLIRKTDLIRNGGHVMELI